jgi:hypothetical protein
MFTQDFLQKTKDEMINPFHAVSRGSENVM